MADPYLGEIRQVGFSFAPRYWAQCNGQLLPIQQNQALFSLLGTQFGGDGIRTFGLPDLRGRSPIGQGSGVVMGEAQGAEKVTMTVAQMPLHTHLVSASTTAGTAGDPTGQVWASVSDSSGNPNPGFTETAPNVTMDPAALSPAGGSQPIPILQPYNVVNYIIALSGIFPSRS